MYDNILRYTTAELRESARHAESNLNWGAAASYWWAAIANYPGPQGAMARADIERMTARAKACEYSARHPTQESQI